MFDNASKDELWKAIGERDAELAKRDARIAELEKALIQARERLSPKAGYANSIASDLREIIDRVL